MTCWSCGLNLPDGARFCARCGLRQRVPGGSAPVWMLLLFTFGTLAAAMLAGANVLVILSPHPAGTDPVTEQYLVAFSWAVFVYGTVLAGLQIAALAGLTSSRDWGRIAATLACLLWCLTGIGLVVAFPVLYFLWRPQPFRR